MKKKKSIIYQILLILAVIVLVNILADKFFVRFDLTGDHRYTLSKATKNIIRDLDEPVTVTAYFTEDLPPQFIKTKRDFKELLVEYNNISKGKVVYEFINPNESQETEMKAMKQGIQPVLINAREKDQVKQQKAYMGALIQMGEQKDVIPFMQQGSAMEYALSSSIKKLTVKDKPLIGFLQGHGEPGLSAFQQVYSSLTVLYSVEPVTLTDTVNNLLKYKTVVIMAPVDSIPESHFRQLDEYLAQGGNLLIAIKRVEGNLNQLTGQAVNTGLEKWLADKGCTVESNFIVDASCASVGMRQSQGMFTYTSNIRFPYLPVITKFADHPAVAGLEAVILPFASSITYSGDTSVSFLPIAFTSDKSGTQPAPVYFDIQKRWTDGDFPLAAIPVAGILSGKLSGNVNSRIVIIANGDFAVNGEGQQAQQIQQDNLNLMVNSIDWLSDDTGLIELRTKGVTARPLDQIDEGKKTFLKYLNFLLPIVIIIGYGGIRMQRNRKLRIKRMEEGYV
ncbi:MAG: Gldg family protein [Bacteroidetes bacterium]|nr:Gldg family protein [Bacteroidota bacterium]